MNTGKCALPDSCGRDDCCICCPDNEECNCQCGEKDGYEYGENCPYYWQDPKEKENVV